MQSVKERAHELLACRRARLGHHAELTAREREVVLLEPHAVGLDQRGVVEHLADAWGLLAFRGALGLISLRAAAIEPIQNSRAHLPAAGPAVFSVVLAAAPGAPEANNLLVRGDREHGVEVVGERVYVSTDLGVLARRRSATFDLDHQVEPFAKIAPARTDAFGCEGVVVWLRRALRLFHRGRARGAVASLESAADLVLDSAHGQRCRREVATERHGDLAVTIDALSGVWCPP